MTESLSETSPHDWKYISEGGSTIVFSYTGLPRPRFDGTALRLRKGPIPAHEDEQPTSSQGDEGEEVKEGKEEEEPDDPTIVFQRTVIERLVPREHLPRLDSVRVERAWLQQLAELTEPSRPMERRKKDRIHVLRHKAVLATDLVGGKGWAVEIKPKWGFLPSPAHLSPATRAIKTRTCRFCMHAHLKHAHGADASVGYCPLDLFSGKDDPARVVRALHALWDAWLGSGAAVNNLKVFVEGKRLEPTTDPTSLSPLAAQLFPNVTTPPSTNTLSDLRVAFIDAILPLLLDTPVLNTLATLQCTLDALDVEGLSALWAASRRNTEDTELLGQGEKDPDMPEWTRFVDMYLARRAQGDVYEGAGAKEEAGTNEEAEAELRYRLTAYLLSASFKDCSIILRLPPPPSGSPDAPGTQGASTEKKEKEKATGTVTVIDLDVKSMNRLGKWAQLDREIVDAYRDMDSPRTCVDSRATAL